MTKTPPWWVPYTFIVAYFLAITYGWLIVDKVTTSDYFIQFGLLMASAFGIQMNVERKTDKVKKVEIEAEEAHTTEREAA